MPIRPAKLPSLSHTCMTDFQSVYEPSDDTFLLCDAIESDRESIANSDPKMAIEIGCGSGCVITFVAKLLSEECISCHCLATDINLDACKLARRTANANNVHVDVMNMEFLDGFRPSLRNKVDVLIFNPPYVPTSDEEYFEAVATGGIEASWAGGTDGRIVIDRFIPRVKEFLSPCGRCYLVLVDENKPKAIARYFNREDLEAEIILSRKAVNESLHIMRITRKS